MTTDGTSVLTNTTEKTGFTVSVAQALECDGAHLGVTLRGEKLVGLQCSFDASKPVELVKHVGLVSSLHLEKEQVPLGGPSGGQRSPSALGYEALKADHEKAWDRDLGLGDIEIEGDVEAQQAIRFNIFHLNQTYRGDDARLNVGPKGFTGEKYGGASYWDTEAYCLALLLGHPSASRGRATVALPVQSTGQGH